MDVRQLRQVLAIHLQGSFVKAADELGIAQPTLSKSIARLEDELGVRLFDRSGAGARVTPVGAMIAARARTIIGESERLGRDIEMVLAGQVGELRIGLGPALRPVFLPRFAEAMAVRWPRLKVRLDVDRRERLQDDFRAGRYDILIAAYAEELPKPDFVQTEVFRSPIVAVASPDHPLAQADTVSVAEFLQYPNAGASTPSMLTAQGAVGDVPPGVRQDSMIECTDDATLKRLAKRGLATVFIQRHEAQADLDAGELVILPIPWRMTLVLTATTTRAASHSPLLQQAVGLARTIGSELYDRP